MPLSFFLTPISILDIIKYKTKYLLHNPTKDHKKLAPYTVMPFLEDV